MGAHHVRRGIAEHGFSSRIARPDEVVAVHGDDGVPGGLYNATETRLALLLCATHHATLYEHQATSGQDGGQPDQDDRGLCRDAQNQAAREPQTGEETHQCDAEHYKHRLSRHPIVPLGAQACPLKREISSCRPWAARFNCSMTLVESYSDSAVCCTVSRNCPIDSLICCAPSACACIP